MKAILILMTVGLLFFAGCVSTPVKDDNNRYDINWGENPTDQNMTDINTNQPPLDLPNQFACQTNDDCIKVDSLTGCGCEAGGPEVAVSTAWLAATTFPALDPNQVCTASYHCTNRVAQCVQNRCLLVYPIPSESQSYETFTIGQPISLQTDLIYQSDTNDVLLTNVSVFEFSCPFDENGGGHPCAVQNDNVSFTLQIVDNGQVQTSQEFTLIPGGSNATLVWDNQTYTITLESIENGVGTITLTRV